MLRSPAEMEAREVVMRMRMNRLASSGPVAAAAPVPATPPAPAEPEGYVTPEKLAKRWHVSPTTIRRWFKNEPGVLKWGRADSRPGQKRAHQSMRIPEHVAERVRRRMARD